MGQKLSVSSPQGRFDADGIDGRKLARVDAYGKHLVYVFAGRPERYVHVHLGLFGRFYCHVGAPPMPRPTTRMRLLRAGLSFDLVGPTACEQLSRAELDRLLARLGPDPLREDADLESAAERLSRCKKAIGAALLDQSLVAGVGNVYRAEILFLHKIHPARAAKDIAEKEHLAMLLTARQLLERGVELGRIVTVSGAGKRPPRGEAVYVYKRSACKNCGERIHQITVGARPIYFCPACQVS